MKRSGEMISCARNAATSIAASPAPRSTKKSTVWERKVTIASVASEPRAWT